MRNYFKKIVYLIVFAGFGLANAGSYDDFFVAIKRDDTNEVAALLKRGFDPNTRDPKGLHGLFLAVREPSLKVAALLIDFPKTQVETRTAQDESPLMMAALKGHLDIARKLVARGADVNKTGWTPLHYAATNGHLDMIRMLLENHAYIDAESPNGTTPLMMASQYGSATAVKLLLEEGADPTLKNKLGLNAIDFAYRVGRKETADEIAATIRAKLPRGKW
jgi:uncharacterized protein